MEELIERDPRNKERIFPYIGGKEVNDSPTQSHKRYVINFGQMTEKEARGWPDLMKIVEERVKGTRGSHSTAEWWHFERYREELYNAIHGLDQVLGICRHQPHWGLAFLPSTIVYSEATIVAAIDSFRGYAILQSRPHELWARFFGSSLEDRLRYTPSDCFETFPFPDAWEKNASLEPAGQEYYDIVPQLMRIRIKA